jgi:hypothetical protein
MTKRDTITYLRLHFVDDGAGGATIDDVEEVSIIPAHVSVNSTMNEITMYGVKTQYMLHVVTDKKLDESKAARYGWSNKIFNLMRQVKSGNEYFSTLLEVSE